MQCKAGIAGDTDLIPGSGRSPGEGRSNPLQYSCLGNPMLRGAWWATVCEHAKEPDTAERLSMHRVWPEGLGARGTYSVLVMLMDGHNRYFCVCLELILSFSNLCVSFPSVTEIVGSKQRRIVGIVIQMFFTLGIIILPGIAYFIPNWQGIQLAITLPNFLFLLYYW